MAQVLQDEEGGKSDHWEKKFFWKKKKINFSLTKLFLQYKAEEQKQHLHPLSWRQEESWNGPQHLPTSPPLQGSTQPGLDLAVPAPSVHTPLWALSWIQRSRHPRFLGGSTPLNSHPDHDKHSPPGPHQDAGEKQGLLERPRPTEKQTERRKRNCRQNRP